MDTIIPFPCPGKGNWYQEAGGISTHFERVLDTPVNYMHRKRTLDMFVDWYRPARREQQLQAIRSIENGDA